MKKIAAILLTILITATILTTSHAETPRFMAWFFDESEGIYAKEFMKSGNDGEFNSQHIQWVEGKRNTGLEFSGNNADNQWLEMPHSDDLNITNGITMEAWIFPTIISPGRPTVIYKRNAYHLRIDQDFTLSVFLWDVKPVDYHKSQKKVKLYEWSHVAVTYNGKEIKFYINGELDSNIIPASGKIQSSGETLLIGGRPSG